MKGIILAGDGGTRLWPLMMVTSKQLLSAYNKLMNYYLLSIFMLARIKDILIISTLEDTLRIERLIKDGSAFGINLPYAIQGKPEGFAQAFTIGKDFIGEESCAMILGDNIFYGNGLGHKLTDAKKMAKNGQACIFGYYVEDPECFDIMEFICHNKDTDGGAVTVLSVEKNRKTTRAAT